MSLGVSFVITNLLLGVGLAMDAFSVSLANGLNEPCMKHRKQFAIAGTFAFFQALMPMIGWVCIHTIATKFEAFEKFIPWIALVLLCFIGGHMLKEGICGDDEECDDRCFGCTDSGGLSLHSEVFRQGRDGWFSEGLISSPVVIVSCTARPCKNM